MQRAPLNHQDMTKAQLKMGNDIHICFTQEVGIEVMRRCLVALKE